jgi:hypothetical protein
MNLSTDHLSLNNGRKGAPHVASLLLAWWAVSGSANAALLQWPFLMLSLLFQPTTPIVWMLCNNGSQG